jgi:hypothetical protein
VADQLPHTHSHPSVSTGPDQLDYVQACSKPSPHIKGLFIREPSDQAINNFSLIPIHIAIGAVCWMPTTTAVSAIAIQLFAWQNVRVGKDPNSFRGIAE